MTTPEGKVKRKVRKWYDDNLPGHYRIAPRGGMFGSTGTSDDVLCWRGVFVSIEVKPYADSEPSAMQMKKLREVVAAGGVAAVVKGYDVEKLEAIKRTVLKLTDDYAHDGI